MTMRSSLALGMAVAALAAGCARSTPIVPGAPSVPAVVGPAAGRTLQATAQAAPTPAPGGSLVWVDQFGPPKPAPRPNSHFTNGYAVAAGGGVVTVGGSTSGVLGRASAGSEDAFVRQATSEGRVRWTTQFGTPDADQVVAIAAGAPGIVAGGTTLGDLAATSAGTFDAFVTLLGANGAILWTRQFGTGGQDRTRGVAVGGGAIYAAGTTFGDLDDGLDGDGNPEANGDSPSFGQGDAFVRKFDATGKELWTVQLGAHNTDAAWAVAADAAGNVYVVGGVSFADLDDGLDGDGNPEANGDDAGLASDDVFVRKLDPTGKELWTRQFGTSGSEQGLGIAVDANGIFVCGYTTQALEGTNPSPGTSDYFVAKLDLATGTTVWLDQDGTTGSDEADAIAADGSGVYVAGATDGSLYGTNLASFDAFARRYASAGTTATPAWSTQLGSTAEPAYDFAAGVAAGGGRVFLAGNTNGTFAGEKRSGFQDAFLARFQP